MNCAINSCVCGALKQKNASILLQPLNLYFGTELNNERFDKLYSTYMALVIEQFEENSGRLNCGLIDVDTSSIEKELRDIKDLLKEHKNE